jgi:hypothetical protein
MVLERGPLSLVRITEELLEWKSRGSGSRKQRLMAVGIRCADHATPLSAKVGTPTSGGRLVSIVCLRTKAMEFSLVSSTQSECVELQHDFLPNLYLVPIPYDLATSFDL